MCESACEPGALFWAISLYIFGAFIALLVVGPNEWNDNDRGLGIEEKTALVLLWPLTTCFVIGSGLLTLVRRFLAEE